MKEKEGKKVGKGKRKKREGSEGRKERVRKSTGYSHMKFHGLTKTPTLEVE